MKLHVPIAPQHCCLLVFAVILAGPPAYGQSALPLPPPDGQESPRMDQPATVVPAPFSGETLEDAFRLALASDQRVEAGQWNVYSAQSTWAAAQAQRMPSLTLGADYYALSDQPAMQVNLAPLPIVAQQPFANRDSGGFQGVVTQPLYTSGRISSGIDAAHSSVHANQADLSRTMLDVKMNVAEAFVVVLRAARLVEVAQAKVASLTGHCRDVGSLFEKGLVSKNDFLSAQVALADAQQQALDANNKLEMARAAYNRALGRNLTEPVQLAELEDDGAASDVEGLTALAMQQRPELAALVAQARALQEQAASERAKTGPQVQLQGGYLYQENRYVDPNGVAGVLLGVQWNAIDMGRARDAASALCQKAEAVTRMRRDAESMIALEVRQRWLELETARQRVQVARQATTQADENLRVARDRYQHQVGTNTEVLDAETLRVQAYTNLFDSSYQAVLAGLRLRRAVGTL
jgi:outer membrane protein TolC